jgi:hypothetical protein
MAYGEYQGMHENDCCLTKMFTRESLLASDWYRERLRTKQSIDIALWTRHAGALHEFATSGMPASQIDCQSRWDEVCRQLKRVKGDSYLSELTGTIGADPSVMTRL